MTDLWRAILLGIVEGVTEFLPISSTGHLILFDRWFGESGNKEFWASFNVFIQIGAIAAVVVYFRKRILELIRGPVKSERTPLEASLTVTGGSLEHNPPNASEEHVPTAEEQADLSPRQRLHVIGLILLASVWLIVPKLAEDWINRVFAEGGLIVAITLGVGGVLMLLLEWCCRNPKVKRMENITWKQAFFIGFAQILAAVFPGTSRSAATIMGGMAIGLSRATAAEFSFFLAIPAMSAACGYKLLKMMNEQHINAQQYLLLAIGTIVSFLVAWVVIAAFMGYIRRHSFVPFAIYRIVLSIFVLLLVA